MRLGIVACGYADDYPELDGADESGDDSAQGDEAEDAPDVSVLEIDDATSETKATVTGETAETPVARERKQAIAEKPNSFQTWFFSLFRRKPAVESATGLKEYVYKLDVANSDERFPIYVVLSTIGRLTAKYGKNNKDFIGKEMQLVAEAVDIARAGTPWSFIRMNSRRIIAPIRIRR